MGRIVSGPVRAGNPGGTSATRGAASTRSASRKKKRIGMTSSEAQRRGGPAGRLSPSSRQGIIKEMAMDHVEIFGSHEPNTLEQLRDVASRAERAALMADGHLGYVMPIGGVAAYRDKGPAVGGGFGIPRGSAAIRPGVGLP